uniref:Uncharacterized protein n=1 Tax=Romanomermis culicivorax TaxID=13658 RepID=A0A915IPN8_ROMCU
MNKKRKEKMKSKKKSEIFEINDGWIDVDEANNEVDYTVSSRLKTEKEIYQMILQDDNKDGDDPLL